MIRGNKRSVPAKADRALQLDFRASIHNRFDVEVLDAATGELKQRARGFNVICDALWDRLFYSSGGLWLPQNYFNYVLYGSGSGTPDATDTTLFNKLGAIQIANDEDVTLTVDRESSVASGQAVVVLRAEDNVGDTITEVGIGYDATHVVTHALLEDMNGNPISIVKTAADVVKIYATLFLHWPAAAWYGGSVNLAPPGETFYRVLFGRSPVGQKYGFYLAGAGTSIQGTGSYDAAAAFTLTPDRANKKLTVSYRFPATDGRGAIRRIAVSMYKYISYNWSTSAALQLLMGSWFTPPAISGEAIGTGDGSTKDFVTAFPVKSGATVKVNGSAASGVTVRTGAPDGSALHRWINKVLGKSSAGAVLYPFSGFGISSVNDAIDRPVSQTSPTAMLENPFYAVGTGAFLIKGVNIHGAFTLAAEASDDLETWTAAGSVTVSSDWSSWASLDVPAALQTKRFFRLTYSGGAEYIYLKAAVPGTAPETNVHFDTAPAAGAVITCDYVPDCIAKDSNHVFDLSMELTLGEYSEV